MLCLYIFLSYFFCLLRQHTYSQLRALKKTPQIKKPRSWNTSGTNWISDIRAPSLFCLCTISVQRWPLWNFSLSPVSTSAAFTVPPDFGCGTIARGEEFLETGAVIRAYRIFVLKSNTRGTFQENWIWIRIGVICSQDYINFYSIALGGGRTRVL